MNRVRTNLAVAVAIGFLGCSDSSGPDASKPPSATQLAFTVQPTTTEAGLIIAPAVQVTALDAFGNPVTDLTGIFVNLAIPEDPDGAGPGGSLSGTTTVAVVGGVAEFTDLRIDQVGTGYTLVAKGGGLRVATSTAFDMTPARPSEIGQIAFQGYRDGDWEIYLMNGDGSGVTQLTDNSVEDTDPTWSPDGSRIAFARGPDGSAEIYVMNADGTSPVRLTSDNAFDFDPAWSPDGSRIAFVSTRDGNTKIYMMNADGTSAVRLTSDNAPDSNPAWSPDGSRIAFGSNRGGIGGIWVMNPDGSGLRRLTSNIPVCGFDACPGDWHPAWSPDGARIAFSRGSSSGGYGYFDIFIVNADGSGLTQLTHGIDEANEPAWSPDGRKIALTSPLYDWDSCPFGCVHILVIRTDGIQYSSFLTPLGESSNPTWRPSR